MHIFIKMTLDLLERRRERKKQEMTRLVEQAVSDVRLAAQFPTKSKVLSVFYQYQRAVDLTQDYPEIDTHKQEIRDIFRNLNKVMKMRLEIQNEKNNY